MVEGFLAGLAIGVVIGLLVARLRQAGSTVSPGANTLAASATEGSLGVRPAGEERGLHIRREIVRSKTVTRLTPDGLSITINGEEFHRLADIPDHLLADRVRETLALAAKSITDPKMRASVEQELRDAGIEPAD